MKKEDKNVIIDKLSEQLKNSPNFYVVDASTLNAEKTTALRRKCFESKVGLFVVKNTLLQKALEKNGFDQTELYSILAGPTALMIAEGASIPAKVIKDFRKKSEKPVLKGAYVQESLYIGDQYVDTLATIKSREELIGDIVALLQSPAKNVISALQSGGSTIAGIVKTLEKRAA
ncbi:50S ribosomal protein L10 [Bacteroidia bacterium]|nr:50S ribosomal protein L10 [Bacteroidia bacterium]GHU96717.1 50S ribosomal protein L10 [Bacteroidia bacterium]